ncbi:MAG: RNA polymerase sigma factor [Fimbriiglobus sp.]
MTGSPAIPTDLSPLLVPGGPGFVMSPADPSATTQDQESLWLTQAQAGDRQAFAKIVDAYWDRLFRWLYQMTRDKHKAEDLTQETFLKVLAAIGSFRIGTNFRAWLFRIGHNNFVNLKRSERRNVQSLEVDVPQPHEVGPEHTASDRETVRRVAEAVSQLPQEFRTALLLRVDEGLSFRDVAGILNITEETARWRVFKARQKLLKILGPDLTGETDEDPKPE